MMLAKEWNWEDALAVRFREGVATGRQEGGMHGGGREGTLEKKACLRFS
jgi:hypothetical protein